MPIKIAVVGATGYTGEEIIKKLSSHKEAEITSLTAIIDKPTPFSELYPAYRGIVSGDCKPFDFNEVISLCDLVFLALPHTVSMKFVPKFLAAGKKVIDLSADYRLAPGLYTEWYKTEHTDPENLSKAVYGLPELFREDIKNASLIANPGCYPTATLLATVPPFKKDLVQGDVIVDAKSGVTGAGRKAHIALSFGEVDENLKAYKINEHQHMPEMMSILEQSTGSKVNINFIPHLIPMRRGILSTVYMKLKNGVKENAVYEAYEGFYKGSKFVRFYGKGKLPEIKNVVNTNFCDIGVKISGDMLIVVSCIDNLLKGASGQAVQNMNLMYGFNEQEGLI